MSAHKKRQVCLICLKRFNSGDNYENSQSLKNSSYSARLLAVNSSNSLNGCQFLKKEPCESVPVGAGGANLYSRFLLFCSRYFKLRLTTDRFLEFAKELRNENGENVEVEAFCGGCYQLVRYICDLYSELETVKLYLVWKLGEMEEVMNGSTRKVSSKLVNGLMACVKEQLNVGSARQVNIFRKTVQLKCKNAGKNELHKVAVPRGLFPEEWKFAYSATKETLMRLIFIFGLASYEVNNKVQEEKDLRPDEEGPPIETPKRRRRPTKKCILSDHNNDSRETRTADGQDGNVKMEVDGDLGNAFDDDYGDDGPADAVGNDSDSDWSAGTAAASPMSANSLNLDDADEEYKPTLQPRTTRKSKATAKIRLKPNETKSDPETEKLPNLKCPQCPRQFVDRRGLAQHLLAYHRSYRPYSCKTCGTQFKTNQDINLHIKSLHKQPGRRRRSRPGNVFKPVRRPGNRDLAPIPTKCTECSETLPSLKQMKSHRREFHRIGEKKKRSECPICLKNIFGPERIFKLHLERHENNTLVEEVEPEPWHCEVCGRCCSTEISVDSHMKRIHNDSYSCTMCDAKLESGKLLRDHLLTAHETESKSFFCEICFRGFTTEQFYDIHRRLKHDDKRKFLCDHESCNEDFPTVSDLNEHMKSHLNFEQDSIFFCKTCKIGFLKEYSLELHEMLHTMHSGTSTGYDCPICGRNARYLETLVTHYNIKHGQNLKPYACSKCGKAFSSLKRYKQHARLHEQGNLGGFVCYNCKAQFTDEVELKEHRTKIHQNKPIVEWAKKRIDAGVLSEKQRWKRRADYDPRLDPSSPPSSPHPVIGEDKAGEDKGQAHNIQKKTGRRGRPPALLMKEEPEEELPVKFNCEANNCKESFENAYSLRKHLENTHEGQLIEKTIQCIYCYKRFHYQQTYKLHIKAEHKTKIHSKFNCDEESCDETNFSSLQDLNEHLKTHTNSEAGKNINHCKLCNWGFMRIELMELHELVHTEPKNELYECPKCHITEFKVKMLQFHYNKEHGVGLKPYSCEICGNGYISRGGLDLHRQANHQDDEGSTVKAFICHLCGRTLKNKRCFQRHKCRQDPDDFCKCEICGEMCRNKTALHIHRTTKHGKAPRWTCDICGYSSMYKCTRKNHMESHQEAQFTCEICGQKFTRLQSLTDHMKRKHDSNRTKEHVCSVCGKGFHSIAGVQYHFESTHVPESEWKLKCDHCPKRFYRRMLLRMHLKSVHGKTIDGKDVNAMATSSEANKNKRRKISKRNKKNEEEDEMTDKSSTDEDNVDDDEKIEKNRKVGQRQYQAVPGIPGTSASLYPQASYPQDPILQSLFPR